VVEIEADGRRVVLDAMANVCLPHPLRDLLARPTLADTERSQDERYRERGYELYATSFWYERVARYRSSSRYRHRLPVWRRR
jgi:hypothetical protein